jgi:hypothetical protein
MKALTSRWWSTPPLGFNAVVEVPVERLEMTESADSTDSVHKQGLVVDRLTLPSEIFNARRLIPPKSNLAIFAEHATSRREHITSIRPCAAGFLTAQSTANPAATRPTATITFGKRSCFPPFELSFFSVICCSSDFPSCAKPAECLYCIGVWVATTYEISGFGRRIIDLFGNDLETP